MSEGDATRYPKAELLTESGVSLEGDAFCILRWGDKHVGCLTPDEMRQLGLVMMAAAEAAEQDAGVVRLMQGMGWGNREIAAFLMKIRESRAD
jgi:hypothetical protein